MNTGNVKQLRRKFLFNLGMQLCIPHMRTRRAEKWLQQNAALAVNQIVDAYDQSIEAEAPAPAPIPPDPVKAGKCKLCVKELTGKPNEYRRNIKGCKNPVKTFCSICKRHICRYHRRKDGNGKILCTECA